MILETIHSAITLAYSIILLINHKRAKELLEGKIDDVVIDNNNIEIESRKKLVFYNNRSVESLGATMITLSLISIIWVVYSVLMFPQEVKLHCKV